MALSNDPPQLEEALIQIGIALTSERNLAVLLERILTEARRFTRAEAGTLYLREGDTLRLAVVQNDRLARRLGESKMRRLLQAEPLHLRERSLAGYVALTGKTLNIPDAYEIPAEAPYSFNRKSDERIGYRTRSVLVVPLRDYLRNVLGVLQLINARDERNVIVRFDPGFEDLVRFFASQAAAAISALDEVAD